MLGRTDAAFFWSFLPCAISRGPSTLYLVEWHVPFRSKETICRRYDRLKKVLHGIIAYLAKISFKFHLFSGSSLSRFL